MDRGETVDFLRRSTPAWFDSGYSHKFDFINKIVDYKEIIKQSFSYLEFSQKLGYKHYNRTVGRKVKKIALENNLDISHFDKGVSKRIKNKREKRNCPVCGKDFTVSLSECKKPKTTCSYSCSNKFFRSGENSGIRKKAEKNPSYARICFKFHKKECIVCGESLVVAVHHFDHNHSNNDPKNLVPLCPTHHLYAHSRHYHLIKEKIELYVEQFKKDNN